MGGAVELRAHMQLEVSKVPKQEQVRHQHSTKLGAPLQVRQARRQLQAGSSAGTKKGVPAGGGRAPLNRGGAAAASSSLSFPIKILDNLEDRNCTCSESFIWAIF